MGPRGEQGPAGPQGPRVSTILVLVFFRWYLLVIYDIPICSTVYNAEQDVRQILDH